MAFPLDFTRQCYFSYSLGTNNPQSKDPLSDKIEVESHSETENAHNSQNHVEIQELELEMDKSFSEGKVDHTLILACKCLLLDPLNLKALTIRAMFFLSSYELDKAERTIELMKQISIDPPNDQLCINLYITLLFLRSHNEEALDFCKAHQSENNPFLVPLEEILKNKLASTQSPLDSKSFKGWHGDMNPTNEFLSLLLMADIALGSFKDLISNNNFATILEGEGGKLDKALPKDHPIRIYVAHALVITGSIRAGSYIEMLKNSYPDNEQLAYVDLLYDTSNGYPQAREKCEDFLNKYPLNPDVWCVWGDLQEKPDDKIAAYSKALQISEGHELANFMMAWLHLETGDKNFVSYCNNVIRNPQSYISCLVNFLRFCGIKLNLKDGEIRTSFESTFRSTFQSNLDMLLRESRQNAPNNHLAAKLEQSALYKDYAKKETSSPVLTQKQNKKKITFDSQSTTDLNEASPAVSIISRNLNSEILRLTIKDNFYVPPADFTDESLIWEYVQSNPAIDKQDYLNLLGFLSSYYENHDHFEKAIECFKYWPDEIDDIGQKHFQLGNLYKKKGENLGVITHCDILYKYFDFPQKRVFREFKRFNFEIIDIFFTNYVSTLFELNQFDRCKEVIEKGLKEVSWETKQKLYEYKNIITKKAAAPTAGDIPMPQTQIHASQESLENKKTFEDRVISEILSDAQQEKARRQEIAKKKKAQAPQIKRNAIAEKKALIAEEKVRAAEEKRKNLSNKIAAPVKPVKVSGGKQEVEPAKKQAPKPNFSQPLPISSGVNLQSNSNGNGNIKSENDSRRPTQILQKKNVSDVISPSIPKIKMNQEEKISIDNVWNSIIRLEDILKPNFEGTLTESATVKPLALRFHMMRIAEALVNTSNTPRFSPQFQTMLNQLFPKLDVLHMLRNEIRSHFELYTNEMVVNKAMEMVRLFEPTKSAIAKLKRTQRQELRIPHETQLKCKGLKITPFCTLEEIEAWEKRMKTPEAIPEIFEMMFVRLDLFIKLSRSKTTFSQLMLEGGAELIAAWKMLISDLRKCLLLFNSQGLYDKKDRNGQHLFDTRDIKDPQTRKLFDSIIYLGNLAGHTLVEVEDSEIPDSVSMDCARHSSEFKAFVQRVYDKYLANL